MEPQSAASLSPSLYCLDVQERFEQRWQSGQPVCLPDFWSEVLAERPALTAPERAELLARLAQIDLERRWGSRVGEPASDRWRLEDYVRVLPELGPVEQLPVDLIAAEYQALRSSGEPVTLDDYAERFPARWSELQSK